MGATSLNLGKERKDRPELLCWLKTWENCAILSTGSARTEECNKIWTWNSSMSSEQAYGEATEMSGKGTAKVLRAQLEWKSPILQLEREE